MGKISVIFTTYNSPEWLEKVIWGFSCQTHSEFEIVIADDGSGPETAAKISALKRQVSMPITHVWQPDEGFQKTRILNNAIGHAHGEYLIFTDGDCIPRNDFVAAHIEAAQPGHFLSGGYFKLPLYISKAISKSDIASGNCFDVDWLMQHGLKPTHKTAKLTARGLRQKLYNALTPTSATWNGHNASAWKKDILHANGFDNRMQYGGEDRELGERLVNAGIKGKQIRYSAIVLHLDHARDYVSPSAQVFNQSIRSTTRTTRRTKTNHGINQLNRI